MRGGDEEVEMEEEPMIPEEGSSGTGPIPPSPSLTMDEVTEEPEEPEESKRRKKDEEKMEEILDIGKGTLINPKDTTSRDQDVLVTIDKDTGERTEVVGLGTKTGEALLEQMERVREGLSMKPEEYAEYRKMWAKTTLREIGIAVPADEKDELNPDTDVINGQLEKGGPVVRIKYILPDPRNPEHHHLFMKQRHARMYARPHNTGIYASRSSATAAEKGDRIPYGVDPIQFRICFGIKNLKKMVVGGETLERVSPLAQQAIRDLIRDGCTLPCLVKTPWLLRVFDHGKKPMSVSSISVLNYYYLLSRYFLPSMFPEMGKAIDRTRRLYEDDATGRTLMATERLNAPENAYLREWTVEKAMNYVRAYHTLKDRKKKTIRTLNHRMEMNDAKLRAWAYYQRDASYAANMKEFYERVSNLVIAYARHMEINEEELFEEGDTDMIKLIRFAKEVSRNELFLHDYWALLVQHLDNTLLVQEMFILFQCYKLIPMIHQKDGAAIEVWNDIRTTPNADPSKPFQITTFELAEALKVSPPSPEMNPAHVAMFQAFELLEKTMYKDYERTLWNETKNIVGDYEQFMGCNRDEFMALDDTSPRLYGGSSLLSVPTMFQLQRSLMFVMFKIRKADAEAVRQQVREIYTANVRRQMEEARERGERIQMVTRYGEEVSSFDEKKRDRP